MRILVCGSRYWTDKKCIREWLEKYSKIELDVTVITGGCYGADNIADGIAKELKLKTLVFPAHWEKYGKSAGPIRNKEMLEKGIPDLVLAFQENLQESKGTKNMIEQAKRFGVDVIIID